METDRLIYRQPDKDDKRIVRIFLTEKGEQLREKAKLVVLNFNEKLLKKISKKEMKDFVKVSTVIREQIHDEIEIYKKNKNY